MGLCVRHVGADADPRGADLHPLPKILRAGADSWKCEGITDSGKQCKLTKFCKKLVGRLRPQAPERACALWLCRIPASFDLLASPEKQKRKAPVPVKLLRTASDTGALLSFWVLFPSEIFLFWQVVPFKNIKIILDVIQCCELRFQFFECGIISFFLRFQRLIFGR